MSLITELSDEFIEELATIIHDEICVTHFAEAEEELDDEEHEDCIEEDLQTVFRLLELLESAGVTTPQTFFTERENHA